VRIVVAIGPDYTDRLRDRIKRYKITQGELSRETGIKASQFTRWFNTPLRPRLDNVVKIETAIAAIRARQKRRAERAKQSR
jgi:predicted transcriptional regulator